MLTMSGVSHSRTTAFSHSKLKSHSGVEYGSSGSRNTLTTKPVGSSEAVGGSALISDCQWSSDEHSRPRGASVLIHCPCLHIRLWPRNTLCTEVLPGSRGAFNAMSPRMIGSSPPRPAERGAPDRGDLYVLGTKPGIQLGLLPAT